MRLMTVPPRPTTAIVMASISGLIAMAIGFDDRARAADLALNVGVDLEHQTTLHEFADERRDRRTVEAGDPGEQRARYALRTVHEGEHGG
jgi:hypothetical protein